MKKVSVCLEESESDAVLVGERWACYCSVRTQKPDDPLWRRRGFWA